jgi:hypothetical protein
MLTASQTLREIGDVSGVRLTEADCLALLAEGQEEFAGRTGILRTDVDLSLTAGQAVCAMPSDYLYPLRAVRSDGVKVNVVTWRWLRTNYGAAWVTVSGPVSYCCGDFDSPGLLRAVPVPEADETLTVTYVRLPAAGTLEVPDPDALRYYCLWQHLLGEGPKQYGRAFGYMDRFEAAVSLAAATERRSLRNRVSRRACWF